jgi:hypothetical protein
LDVLDFISLCIKDHDGGDDGMVQLHVDTHQKAQGAHSARQASYVSARYFIVECFECGRGVMVESASQLIDNDFVLIQKRNLVVSNCLSLPYLEPIHEAGLSTQAAQLFAPIVWLHPI